MPLETSPNLELPYILAAQAQKHVTHNEAIRALDAVVQIAAADRDLSAPPPSPADGARYIVGPAPAGAWAGHANEIAAFQDGAWAFYAPNEGWLAWVADEDRLFVWDGAAWLVANAGGPLQNVPLLGVNATADSTNRLSINSSAVLFNNAGAGHQIKINKAATGDTASMLYQTGFSGRAEFGTTGDDNFHVKVSSDGSNWAEALTIDTANSRVGVFKPAPARTLDAGGDFAATNCFFTGTMQITNVAPIVRLIESGAGPATDAKRWIMQVDNSELVLALSNDANTTTAKVMRVTRSAMTPTGIAFTGPISSQGPIAPQSDNAHALGSATNRWSVVYAATGTINTSDERLKTDIVDCPLGLDFIRSLEPKLYRWREGGTDVKFVEQQSAAKADGADVPEKRMTTVEMRRSGRRRHAGLLAQNVRQALNSAGVDCGLWVLDDMDDEESGQSLRYDQFIAPLIQAMKDLAGRVEKLEGGNP